MFELLWTIVGAVAALTAAQLWRAATRARTADAAREAPVESETANAQPANAQPTNAQPANAPPAPIIHKPQVAADSRRLALSLAEELANLASAVEGSAHHLIEAAPTRTHLPRAAEAMLGSVRRLHTLHTKLVAFGHGRTIEQGTTDVAELIDGLGDELQQMQLGLELHWEPPPDLPLVEAHPRAVRDAMLFLCAAMLRAERGATRLTFVAERSFSRERPTIKVEMTLEWITESQRDVPEELTDATFTLDLEAAHHLLANHNGELTLSHLPGKSVRALVRLPMAIPAEMLDAPLYAEPLADEATDEPEPTVVVAPQPAPTDRAPTEREPALHEQLQHVPAATSDHDFGGALVLESDPSLRAVLARELKASGRAVFACADGASAHTFLEATPDRFELLIVDDAQQLERHTQLARTIRERVPALKICLLSRSPNARRDEWPALHCLQKPFGVHELRRTLASILTPG